MSNLCTMDGKAPPVRVLELKPAGHWDSKLFKLKTGEFLYPNPFMKGAGMQELGNTVVANSTYTALQCVV